MPRTTGRHGARGVQTLRRTGGYHWRCESRPTGFQFASGPVAGSAGSFAYPRGPLLSRLTGATAAGRIVNQLTAGFNRSADDLGVESASMKRASRPTNRARYVNNLLTN